MPRSSLGERIERELASLLKERREELGLSKVVTAERAGVAIMTVFFIEERKRSPSINTLIRLCSALEVELWELLRRATEAAKATEK